MQDELKGTRWKLTRKSTEKYCGKRWKERDREREGRQQRRKCWSCMNRYDSKGCWAKSPHLFFSQFVCSSSLFFDQPEFPFFMFFVAVTGRMGKVSHGSFKHNDKFPRFSSCPILSSFSTTYNFLSLLVIFGAFFTTLVFFLVVTHLDCQMHWHQSFLFQDSL